MTGPLCSCRGLQTEGPVAVGRLRRTAFGNTRPSVVGHGWRCGHIDLAKATPSSLLMHVLQLGEAPVKDLEVIRHSLARFLMPVAAAQFDSGSWAAALYDEQPIGVSHLGHREKTSEHPFGKEEYGPHPGCRLHSSISVLHRAPAPASRVCRPAGRTVDACGCYSLVQPEDAKYDSAFSAGMPTWPRPWEDRNADRVCPWCQQST